MKMNNSVKLGDETKVVSRTPKFLLMLAFVEMWERFSYYGMRVLLTLYLINFMKMQDSIAYSTYAVFGTFSYVGCVLFGYLSDKFLGARNTVTIGALIMLIGHALMAVSHLDGYANTVFLALSLICIGTSAFKGNITNILGLCYNQNPGYNKDAGYTMFYVAVNVGSFFAALICGHLGQSPDYGWGWGFGLAAVGMLIGLIFLKSFEYILGNAGEMPEEYRPRKMQILISFFFGILGLSYVFSYVLVYADAVKQSGILDILLISIIIGYMIQFFKDVEYRKNSLLMFIIAFFTGAFYVLEMQLGGLLKVFIDRNVNLTFNLFNWREWSLMSSQIESINPATVMIFGFILSLSKMKDNENSFYRFLFGLLCIPLCFLILYMGCVAHVDGLVPFAYVLWAFIIMSVGETFIGPMGQSQVSKLSNPSRRGMSFAFFMFFLGASNSVGGTVAKYFAVDTTEVANKLFTLNVYKEGFINIIIWNLALCGVFLLLIPFLRSTYRQIMSNTSSNA